MSKKFSTIFLDITTKEVDYNDKYNIVLSPALYWTKVVELPAKTIYGAREYTESIFAGMLSNDLEYQYHIQKTENNQYRFFAFCKETIKEQLEELNIDILSVKAIYFAQNEFDKQYHISINENRCMVTLHGTMCILPYSMVTDAVDIDEIMETISLSKNKVQFLTEVNIDIDVFKYVVMILIILNVSFGINSINDNIKIHNEENKLNNKIDKLKLPHTNYELRALATKHQDIVKEQLKIREKLKKY
jgi:hypothetical protein